MAKIWIYYLHSKMLHFSYIRASSSQNALINEFSWKNIVFHPTQWLRCCATNQKVAGLIPAGVTGFFIDIKSFRSHYGPGVDSASNRNEYQGYFLGIKAAGAWGWQTYHHPMPVVTKSGNLNFLEPSGPVQACSGTALPLPLPFLFT